MPDLLKPLLPQPKGRLQAGLLWTGGLADYQVELHWPAGVQEIPSPEAVEVRVYPTSFGWFGWTVDKILSNPEVSADRRTWTYKSDPAAKMDWAYSVRVDAATEMVAVFCEEDKTPGGVKSAVPSIRVISPSMGAWKRMDVEIEWGFQPGTEKTDFDGRLESHVAMIGPVSPLADDKGTTVTGAHSWQSRAAGDAQTRHRRAAAVRSRQSPGFGQPGYRLDQDGRFHVSRSRPGERADPDSGTRRFRDEGRQREDRPAIRRGIGGQEPQEHSPDDPRTSRGRLLGRAHAGGPAVDMSGGDGCSAISPGRGPSHAGATAGPRWTDAWRAASFQLKGKHMWGGLAFEVGRVAHEMDMVGLHDEADKVYEHFLKAPGAKSDGDYADGNGALEWATAMRHDMGYSHDGTHASTGRLLFAMAERYFLTGDKEWFQRNRVRMQAAADWIIRQRTLYMKDIPNRQDLFVAGLMPPCMLGDYAMPSLRLALVLLSTMPLLCRDCSVSPTP